MSDADAEGPAGVTGADGAADVFPLSLIGNSHSSSLDIGQSLISYLPG